MCEYPTHRSSSISATVTWHQAHSGPIEIFLAVVVEPRQCIHNPISLPTKRRVNTKRKSRDEAITFKSRNPQSRHEAPHGTPPWTHTPSCMPNLFLTHLKCNKTHDKESYEIQEHPSTPHTVKLGTMAESSTLPNLIYDCTEVCLTLQPLFHCSLAS